MRGIKFRVWDGRKICEVKNIEFAEDGVKVTKDDGRFGYLGSDLELLPYTGLEDKNGEEIYRGHILDCSYVNPMTGEKVLKLYEVVFRNGSFMAKHKDSPYGDTLLHFINKTGKVVGYIQK
jgi:hypothetical protein